MRTVRFVRARVLATTLAVLALGVAAGSGCNQGAEGDRCNAALNANGHDECGGGTTCTAVPLCPETYCCPLNSDGTLAASDNPNCQPGCNGGAASICNSGLDDAGACAFACKNDPGDLASTAVCAMLDGGASDGGSEASTPEAGPDAPASDAKSDAPENHDDGSSDAGAG